MKPLESFVKSHHDELMVRRLIIRVSGVREGERGEGRGGEETGGMSGVREGERVEGSGGVSGVRKVV